MSTAVMSRTTVEPPNGLAPEVIPEPVVAPKRRSPKAKLVLAGLALTFAAVGTTMWLTGRGKETTDDAFVEGHVATVAARVQGQVVRVNVKDNQLVEVGTVLVEIDDRDAKVRLTTAEADLLSAKANLSSSETQLALTERNADAAY